MISIIGAGRVGSSIAFLCVSSGLDDVVLVDKTKDDAIGESLDLANAIPSTSKFSIDANDDFSKISGSDIVVVTASTGVYMQSRTENLTQQVSLIKDIGAKIKQYCPSAIVLIISNPLDVLTYFFQKETGFSRFKVIGVASSLDSSRFRLLVSKKFSVSQSDVSDAIVLGEHDSSMVPIFSKVSVKGKPLLTLLSDEEKNSMTQDVREYWKKLRKYKSRSQYGIAKNAFDILEAIKNSNTLSMPASVVLEGEYQTNDVAMGVPVKINQNGISEICEINLNPEESSMLNLSSETIRNLITSIET